MNIEKFKAALENKDLVEKFPQLKDVDPETALNLWNSVKISSQPCTKETVFLTGLAVGFQPNEPRSS